MSIAVMDLVWKRFPASGSKLLTMLALADWCNDEGGSLRPSIPTLAKKIRMTTRQTQKIMRQLERDEFLFVVGNENGGATSRRYQLNIKKLSSLQPLNSSSPPQKILPLNSSSPPGCHPVHPTPELQFTQSVSDTSGEPSPNTHTAKNTYTARVTLGWEPTAEIIREAAYTAGVDQKTVWQCIPDFVAHNALNDSPELKNVIAALVKFVRRKKRLVNQDLVA